ncbi:MULTISPECIES: GntR family transcriptional regulator [Dactylosporangium]|uniref:GntR family transcriptional regulator n=2 Tax=Dactylosporangium TaxID=35753 RepID=A0A9W6KUB3_9ACTN|nr:MULTISPECIES: GntR family transcriptional regulator [Dactylosporangium]UAB98700.1 GntR family transcriptional regulator [Dactylosporangium vinaceum]UWZ46954.1 GntR family transcriptional regulator [Dactylosporangium matsuzakiense]GLL06844.1 GntR family transcriptional regulator [Dactylosporangium matsuzakiense]
MRDTAELTSASLVELAVLRLTREILGGGTEPGERLVEEQLTKRFGISRAPLREALRLLAQQGLVEHMPRRGVRVAILSDADIRELYEVRDVLERHAVTATPPDADLTGITTTMKALQEADAHGDQFEVATAHRDFHVAVVALAGNRQLSLVYSSVLVKIQLYMALNLRREAAVARPHDGVHRHERLFDAVSARDPEAVLAALNDHGARSYLAGP